jgi:hypothetical protein
MKAGANAQGVLLPLLAVNQSKQQQRAEISHKQNIAQRDRILSIYEILSADFGDFASNCASRTEDGYR